MLLRTSLFPQELYFTKRLVDPSASLCGATILPPRSGSTFPADLLGGDLSTRSHDDLDDALSGRPEVRRAGLLSVVACLKLAISPRVRGGDT